MKYVFLLNLYSLKDKLNTVKKAIEDICITKELDYKFEINSEHSSTEEILKKYKNSSNLIMAVGGDGTINRVLNGIVGTKNILGYVPYGTGNDFYRSNKELLQEGFNKIDLVNVNNRYFINVACFGIDAEIGNNNDFVHSKFIPKKLRYTMSLLYHFLTYKDREYTIKINDEVYKDLYTTVTVCNGKYYGGGYKIGYNSLLDDGLIDVYLVPKLNKIDTAKLILGMNKGKHETSKKVKKIPTTNLIITSPKEVECNLDGELIVDKRFDISIIPDGIEVYYDQKLIDDIQKKLIKIK